MSFHPPTDLGSDLSLSFLYVNTYFLWIYLFGTQISLVGGGGAGLYALLLL